METTNMSTRHERDMASILTSMARELRKKTHPNKDLKFIDAFWEVYHDRFKHNRTAGKQEQQALTLASIMGEGKLLREIDNQTLSYIKQKLIEGGRSMPTVHRYFNLLRATMAHIRDNRMPGLILPNFKAYRNPKAERNRESTLSKQMEAMMLAQADEELADLITVLLYTGLRLGEALSLTYERSIDLAGGKLTVFREHSKGKVARSVPMLPQVKKVLFKRQGGVRPFLKSQTHYHRHFSMLRDKLGIRDKDMVFHALRHSAATRLLEAGVSLPVVQQWMGHASVATTMKYVHLTSAHLDQAAEALASW